MFEHIVRIVTSADESEGVKPEPDETTDSESDDTTTDDDDTEWTTPPSS